jgi:hypothetical protein
VHASTNNSRFSRKHRIERTTINIGLETLF